MKKLFHVTLVILGLALTFTQNSNAEYNPSSINNDQEQIWSYDWDSAMGRKLLKRSNYNDDFYSLLNFYQPQINPLYCSAATGVMILNALNYGNISNQKINQIIKPKNLGSDIIEYPLYSQEGFFNEKTDSIKNRYIINFKAPKEIKYNRPFYDPGLTLSEFQQILTEIYDLKVEKITADTNDEAAIDKLKQQLKEILVDDTKYLVANFHGEILGKTTQGHISPIVAYNYRSNAVLIMDVALHKNKWYWVKLDQLYRSMNTKDGKTYRGYLVISKKKED